LLRNGNVLVNCLGTVRAEIARQVKGGTEDYSLLSALYAPQPHEDAGVRYADYFAKLTPAGQTVWEWRSFEHLDPVSDGIAEVQALDRGETNARLPALARRNSKASSPKL
jgi:hypothetical protein